MTPILPVDSLARVMFLLSGGREEAPPGLSEADRRLVEAVVGSACLGPVALDEYLTALARSAGDRHGEATGGPHDPAAWEALLRGGLPGLSDEDLLAFAASPDAVRELNDRVDTALCDGTSGDVWWALYGLSAETIPPDPEGLRRVQEIFELYSRLHAVWSGRAVAPRPPDADTTD